MFCQENSWMIAFNFVCLSHNSIRCPSEQFSFSEGSWTIAFNFACLSVNWFLLCDEPHFECFKECGFTMDGCFWKAAEVKLGLFHIGCGPVISPCS